MRVYPRCLTVFQFNVSMEHAKPMHIRQSICYFQDILIKKKKARVQPHSCKAKLSGGYIYIYSFGFAESFKWFQTCIQITIAGIFENKVDILLIMKVAVESSDIGMTTREFMLKIAPLLESAMSYFTWDVLGFRFLASRRELLPLLLALASWGFWALRVVQIVFLWQDTLNQTFPCLDYAPLQNRWWSNWIVFVAE